MVLQELLQKQSTILKFIAKYNMAFIPDDPVLAKKELGEGFTPDAASFVEDPKPSTLGERFRASFGGEEAKSNIVEGHNGGFGEFVGDVADVAGEVLPFAGAALGAAGGTILGTPVGGVAGAAIGAGAGESAKQSVGRMLGVRGDKSVGSEAADIALAAGFTWLGGKAGQYVVSRLPKLLGIFSGESDDAIRAALANPKAADIGIQQGDEALRIAVQEAGANSIKLRTNFIKSYTSAFDTLAGNNAGKLVSKKDVLNPFVAALKDSKISVKNGVLDFATSKIKANPGEMAKINSAYEAITQWDDWSLRGVNQLKQLVQSLTKFADDAGVPSKSPFLGSFSHTIDSIIKTKLPRNASAKYAAMNKKFSDSVELFDDMVDAFNKGDPFTKLAGVFGQNKDTLRQVVDYYDKQTGAGLKSIIAGRVLGEEKNAAFGIINPRSWIDFFISPKMQGGIITRAGKIANPIAGTSRAAYETYSQNVNAGFESLSNKASSVIRNLKFGQ